MNDPLAIVRVGMICPVGLDAEQSAASIWAGVMRKQETSIMDRRFEPIVMGTLPYGVLPELVEPLARSRPGLTSLQRRMVRLLAPALHEVLGVESIDDASAGNDEPRHASTVLPPGLQPLPPLLLAGPQPHPDRPEIMTGRFIGQAALQAGVPVDASTSRVFPTGHAGFFAALQHAQSQVIGPGRAEFAVVGGVDSYLDLYRLALLEREQRLLTFGAQDAFTPAEAAACVLLASRVACRRYGIEPLAWIDAVGVAMEPGHRYSDEPYRGDGLSEAFRQAFAAGPSVPPVRLVMAGFTGESMHAKEWGVAQLRSKTRFAAGYRVEHSAEYTGDTGAALGPMMLGAAVLAMADSESAVEGPALVWGSSERGQRGALLVQAA